jgi:glycosyltransferase involved in cell wall biosynthesis
MKVSVVVITYNQERTIGQALESALAQRVNFDYEIVVGEDCSTDRTREIVMDFQRRHPERIVPLLREHNIGGPENAIETRAACRGQYIAALAGDDYWIANDKLQKEADFLDAHPDCVICCSRAQILDEAGTHQYPSVYPSLPPGDYTVNDLLQGNFVMTCTVMYRRESVGQVPDWLRKRILGDWPLYAIMATKGKIHLMDEVMAMYRVHAEGLWSTQPLSYRLGESAQMLADLDSYLKFRYTDTIRRNLAGYHWTMAELAQRQGERIETMKHVAGYLRNGGLRFPGSKLPLAALVAYGVLGPWSKALGKVRRAILRTMRRGSRADSLL